ncbi:MAG: aldo/keto reductase [Spirochaetales bacterium]|jgi:aryl-alcohol dehydrogenase-like predicted oxidoreductase|nr:aldo/keto reductase [Spirochaetales bacterium]
MKYGKLGRTNTTVSKICLGTMHFGSGADEDESFRIMDCALDNGINFFDTADIYGPTWGRSEEIIGKWLNQRKEVRDKIVLATKVYWYDQNGPEWPNLGHGVSMFKVRKNLEASLTRLQTDHIDLYQVHHIDREVSEEEWWNTFDLIRIQGLISYIGTSNFPGWGLAQFQQAALKRGLLGIVSEQHMYNLFCRYPELEVLPAAQRFGIGVLAYMPLGGGLLTGNRTPEKGTRTASVAEEYGIDLSSNNLLDQYSAVCKEIGEEERNVAIAWTLAHPAVSSAIVGIRKVEHLEGILRAAEIRLEQEVIDKLNSIFTTMSGRPLRNNLETPEAYAW